MVLDTAEKMYRYFLAQVRKEHTVVISPTQWNDMINPYVLDWVKSKLPERDFNQKRIDDLHVLYNRNTINESTPGYFEIPKNYLSGSYAEFVGKNDKSTTPATEGKMLRGDQRTVFKKNPYRQEGDEFVYFELRHGFLMLVTTESIHNYNRMFLGFYKYPEQIIYDPQSTKEECRYTLTCGSYYNTWNGASVDLYLDGKLIIPGAKDTSDSGDNNYSFTVKDKQEITTIYKPGTNDKYNNYGIASCNGTTVWKGNPSSAGPGNINAGDLLSSVPSSTPGVNASNGSFDSLQNKEIMDLAVTKYLESVSDPRIQTQPGVQVPG